MRRFHYWLLCFVAFAVSLVLVTAVQAQVEFRADPQMVLPQGYQQWRQEPNYAGCRCGCQRSRLLALVPENGASLTVSAHPDFFVNVPALSEISVSEISDRSEEALRGEFWLGDTQTYEPLYSIQVPIPEQAGIMRFQLPADFPGLQMGQDYGWGFNLICDVDYSYTTGVSGIVRRVEPPAGILTLGQGTPQQLASYYASHGIWVEAIATLAQARQDFPEDLAILASWRSLLQSVGLDSVADRPLISYLDLLPGLQL